MPAAWTQALSGLQVALALSIIGVQLVVVAKPAYEKALREHRSSFLRGQPVNAAGRLPWLDSDAYIQACCALRAISQGAPPSLYYLAYATISILALAVYPPLCAFLLLDVIAKSSTTRDVLMAVYIPRRELLATASITVICVYIFSVIYFFSYRLNFKVLEHYLFTPQRVLFSIRVGRTMPLRMTVYLFSGAS